jgi:hypothetical protein
VPPALGPRPDAAFVVHRWEVDGDRRIRLRYSFDGPVEAPPAFSEVIEFPAPVPSGEPEVARLLDLLAVVAGTSYFKAAAPRRVHFDGFDVDPAAHAVVTAAYDHGLREYAHHQPFDIPFRTGFPDPTAVAPTPTGRRNTEPERPLLPFGGGKDSSLLASALVDRRPTLFTIGEHRYVGRVADALGLELVFASRRIDPLILRSAELGLRNGHVPVTAINTLVSLVHAASVGADAVVLANERSASADTIPGINHQYSKSLAFERLLRGALTANLPDTFSAVRPWGDLAIARAFVTHTTLLPHFMSCNRAFLRDPARRSDGWCGHCDKCRSVYLSLAPFTTPAVLAGVFGRDLLADPAAVDGFRALVVESDKPFDCVADIDEARAALWLAAAEPVWADHAVVRELVGEGHAVEPADDTFLATADHDVPDGLFAELSTRVFARP